MNYRLFVSLISFCIATQLQASERPACGVPLPVEGFDLPMPDTRGTFPTLNDLIQLPYEKQRLRGWAGVTRKFVLADQRASERAEKPSLLSEEKLEYKDFCFPYKRARMRCNAKEISKAEALEIYYFLEALKRYFPKKATDIDAVIAAAQKRWKIDA